MQVIVNSMHIVIATCIRCNKDFVVLDDNTRIGLDSTTLSPLRPDATLTEPDDPDYVIARFCPPCNAIADALAPEIALHKNDLITYFKVVFPHGRYHLITRTDTATPDHRNPINPSNPHAPTSLRNLIEHAQPATTAVEYARHQAQTELGATVAEHIEWETDERHDRLYGQLRHGYDSITVFYEHNDPASSGLFVSCPCPAEPTCPLGYDDARETANLLHVLDGTVTEDPRCPVHTY